METAYSVVINKQISTHLISDAHQETMNAMILAVNK